jgi:hypothetical protein
MLESMAKLFITRRSGEVFEVQVDDADLERVEAAGPWHVQLPGKSRRTKLYVWHHAEDGTFEYLHRWLMEPGVLLVDHVNGDGLDCRRENLRLATRSQNGYNRGVPRTNTSGFKGVTWAHDMKQWKAQIGVNRKHINLGFFDSPEDAHAAYLRAAEQHHGEFKGATS